METQGFFERVAFARIGKVSRDTLKSTGEIATVILWAAAGGQRGG
jgi:hypothetical protein